MAVLALVLTGAFGCQRDSATGNESAEVAETAPLSEHVESRHFVFHFATGDNVSAQDVEELEIHYAGFVDDFGLQGPETIHYYKYASHVHKEFHTGMSGDGFADLEARAIHSVHPNSVHELVHVLAASLGDPVSFLREGLAVAYPGYYSLGYARFGFGTRDLHAVWRGWMGGSNAAPLRELLDEDAFWSSKSMTVAYVQSGSFVRYLIDTRGVDRFRQLFSLALWPMDATQVEAVFETVYPDAFELVVRQWEDFVIAYQQPS
jgi:hypothetical protein